MRRRSYKGAVALVTGGASGIGRGLGEALVAEGAQVILADHDEVGVRQVAARLGCEGRALDVRDAAAFDRLVREVIEAHGRLDLLCNNAGVAITGEAHLFDYEEDWSRIIDVNLYGVIHGVHAAYPRMVEQGFGQIVNVASIAGLFPSAGQASYVASKYAVVGLSHALRAEAAGRGVQVSVVCPGIIHTTMRDTLTARGGHSEALRELLPQGMSVERCVAQMLRGMRRDAPTVLVTPMAHALAGLMRLSPRLALALNQRAMTSLRARLGA